MKRLIVAALAAFASFAFGATTVPPGLINPAGSTSGQAIVSTGPTTPPTFGSVPMTAVTGTLPIANGGTNATSASAALTNLGAQSSTGVTDGSSAAAGKLGQYATNSTTSTSLTTATPANLTSVSLTAGDWDVQCVGQFNPAASTVLASAFIGVSTTSATFGALGSSTLFRTTVIGSSGVASLGETLSSPVVRVNVAATTTVYCVGQSSFTTSTMTGDGFIRARRIR